MAKKLKSLKANIERRNILEKRNTCAKASVSGGFRISKKTKTGDWISTDVVLVSYQKIIRFRLDDF